MTKKEKALRAILEPAIDFNSTNVYSTILYILEHKMPVEGMRLSFTLKELRNVLVPLSKEWEKGIDEIIGLK